MTKLINNQSEQSSTDAVSDDALGWRCGCSMLAEATLAAAEKL